MARTRSRIGIVAGTAVLLLLVSQTAYANTTLASHTVVSTGTPASYDFATTLPYWSIVAVADTGSNYDLSLYVPNGRLPLASSTYAGTGVTDFIAINSNDRALGGYTAKVTHPGLLILAGSTAYVEQIQGSTVTTLPTPDNNGITGPGDPDLAFASVNSQDVIGVSDVFLNAGDKFWVNVTDPNQYFYFLESNPSDSSTFIRTRAQAAAIPGTSQHQGCTLYTANYTGWHGLVEVNQDLPHPTNPQEGLANAIVRYDPARPTTCPQRNFPDPTPAGP